MAHRFGVEDVHGAHPPCRKVDAVGEPSQERDHEDIAPFLFVICECAQKRVWVTGEVVDPMVLPEPADLVHGAMVPVKVEIEDACVCEELDGEPPREAGQFVSVVCDETGKHRTNGDRADEGPLREGGGGASGEEQRASTRMITRSGRTTIGTILTATSAILPSGTPSLGTFPSKKPYSLPILLNLWTERIAKVLSAIA